MNPRSELFGLILIEYSVWVNQSSDPDAGIVTIGLEWIPTRNFHQGTLIHIDDDFY